MENSNLAPHRLILKWAQFALRAIGDPKLENMAQEVQDSTIQPLRLEDGENSPKNSTILTVNLDYITSAL